MSKPSIDPVRWQPPPSTPLREPDLVRELWVVALPGFAPEDVVVDGLGGVLTGVVGGEILRIDAESGLLEVIGNTGGRPLGLAVSRDGRLLICDSHRGLVAMNIATGDVETLVDEFEGRPLTFCSNVVEASDGTIYFTESTDRFHYEYYKAAVIEARGSGSLFRRDPDGTVTRLLSGLFFANGVTLTADESAVVFAETTGARVSKFWLTGAEAGTVTPLIDALPGYPDNISTGPDGRIWVAMVSDRNGLTEWLAPRAPGLRKLLWHLPYGALPDVKPVVWVIALDPDDGRVLTQLRARHSDFGSTTGVVQEGNRVWLAGIGAPTIAYFDLS
ncbi:SMP-30/gluconolactonase/LRE family protein [Mycolicibacterium hodleri]|uniref:SMP-30/gluconolactonase/LRE family protein n=1 Tax=Mycolicibacterium hodleri TaxID=49897 RepID=A0A502EA79_9MYCO|nr:SMP-30/gluconolactonase/LRE family protein [Mycolicibacterium hodleri]TPG34628.1 SMP-30/gluconolactonase/LRE family protein [Mycolicibacterium hodleri]